MNSPHTLRKVALGAALGVGAFAGVPHPAGAYPIDCAILLCMAGGFPASAECAAAKREVIRRITPHPVEPPLQLWNCPMNVDPEVASSIGLAPASLGSDGLTSEVRGIRDAIEIYQISFRHYTAGDKDKEILIDHTVTGDYDNASGEFAWKRASYQSGPAWLSEVSEGFRADVFETDNEGRRRVKVGEVNDYRGTLRAVALRFRDHEGRFYSQLVRY
ncbi:hypothetical protein LAZ40_03440 [Cereibacter sphaeroides]|uniref:hypothetical protein n=1 Tax=Cereibacter sphaeroides TaxID=1063 RepID=UPI001F3980DA|nr:hypothetical protein [Cereibacter sphaeroides]MCE6958109.1 hypothetical protein [Cereibacter sphaeroides]MCE6971654.1 hypothetical protein [Cereibacter sphaeroides]